MRADLLNITKPPPKDARIRERRRSSVKGKPENGVLKSVLTAAATIVTRRAINVHRREAPCAS